MGLFQILSQAHLLKVVFDKQDSIVIGIGNSGFCLVQNRVFTNIYILDQNFKFYMLEYKPNGS